MIKPIQRVREQQAVRLKQQARAAWIAEGERMERQLEREIDAIEAKKRAKKWWQFWR